MKKATILIVDDSVIFSQGLELLLTQSSAINSVTIAHNYTETLEVLKSTKIDVVILDLNFDSADFDGFIIAKKIKQLYPKIKIMILTQHAQIDHYETLINDYKVNAYLDKQLGVEETFTAINKVLNGACYIDKNITEMLSIGRWLDISKREKDVVTVLSTGMTQKEIADKLFIAPKTVETHIRNLCEKFNAKNSTELVSMYIKYRSANRENIDQTMSPFKKI